jgi:hypothetical protein
VKRLKCGGLPTKKSSGPNGFTGELSQIVKELTPVLTLLHKTDKEGRLLHSFYEAIIILIPKTDQGTTTTKKKKMNFFDETNLRILKIIKNPQ